MLTKQPKSPKFNFWNAFLKEMKEIQEMLLTIINEGDNNNKILEQLVSKIQEKRILHEFLYLLSTISNNSHRTHNFFTKVETILIKILPIIQENFSNSQLWHIFKENKRLLLFLLQQKLIIINEDIITTYINGHDEYNYKYYFYPEIKPFLDQKECQSIEREINSIEDFEDKRKRGENDCLICELLREDKMNAFVDYVNRNDIKLRKFEIELSIFETNPLLYRKVSLIQYASFFGSINIFTYLILNRCSIDESLLVYALHSNNVKLINLIENLVNFNNEICLFESMQCHNIDLCEHFLSKMSDDDFDFVNLYAIKFHNYQYISDDLDKSYVIHQLCASDYIKIVEFLVENTDVDFEMKMNENESTPLQMATNNGNEEIVNIIVQNKGIKDKAFYSCIDMKQITIPESIKRIGNHAFFGCESLYRIVFNSSLESICSSCFGYCASLEEIILPKSLKSIGKGAFQQCSSLKKVSILSELERIEEAVFFDCESLEEVHLPDSVKIICKNAFAGCSNLKEIKLPSSLVTLKSRCFHQCFSLKKIEIPQSVTSIGQICFNACKSLEEVVIHSQLKRIETDTFSCCESLKKINIPLSVEYICSNAFNGCLEMREVVFNSTKMEIESFAFSGCPKLEEVKISSKTKLGVLAFGHTTTIIIH